MVKKKGTKKKKNIVKPTKMDKNGIINYANSSWFSYVWNKLSDCWEITIDLHTMYKIQRMNTEAQASKNLIVKMIGKKGMQFYKGEDLVKDAKWQKIITDLFTDPVTKSFKSFKDKYYTNHFCSGNVNAFFASMWNWETKIQVMDTRGMKKEFDGFGNIKEVEYNTKKIKLEKFHSQITQYDPNNQNIGMSIYESIVFDAMSDFEASKRNFYFFKNNAAPSLILTLSDDIENEEEMKEAITQFKEKFSWSENSHWVMASSGIKEVKTVSLSNKDIELLELKKFAIKKMWVVYWFDPRFLWYKDDKNGSHAEYEKMANQSDKSMTSFADILEEFMLAITRRVYPEFPYNFIELINDKFLDEQVKQDMILAKMNSWAISMKRAAIELWYSIKDIPKYMDVHVMQTQMDSVENILNKEVKPEPKEVE